MMLRMGNRAWSVLVLGYLLAVLGCGRNTVEVKGLVTFDGKPLEKGSIAFEPADGNGPSSGATIQDGRYELTGKAKLSPGSKIVRIRGTRKAGKMVPAMPGSSQMVETVEEIIPANYNRKSTLKKEVEPGKINEFNFDLKKP